MQVGRWLCEAFALWEVIFTKKSKKEQLSAVSLEKKTCCVGAALWIHNLLMCCQVAMGGAQEQIFPVLPVVDRKCRISCL